MFCFVSLVASAITFENCVSAYSQTSYTFKANNLCIEGPFFVESTNNKNYDVYYGEKDNKGNYPTSVSDQSAVTNAAFINCRYKKECAAVIVCKSDSEDCNIAVYPSASSFVDEVIPYHDNYHLKTMYSIIARSPTTAYIGNKFYKPYDHYYLKQVSVTIAMNQFPENKEATIKSLNGCKPDMNVYTSENSAAKKTSTNQITDPFTMNIDKPMVFEMVIDDTKIEKQIMINFTDSNMERKPSLIVPPIPGAIKFDELIVLNELTDPLSHFLFGCIPYSPIPPSEDTTDSDLSEVFPGCLPATPPTSSFKIYEFEKDKELCLNGQFILAYNDEILVQYMQKKDNELDQLVRYYKNPNIVKDGVISIKCVKPAGSKCKLQIASLVFNSNNKYYVLINNNFTKTFEIPEKKKDITIANFNNYPTYIKITADSENTKYTLSSVPITDAIKTIKAGTFSYIFGKEQILQFDKSGDSETASKFTIDIKTYPDAPISSTSRKIESIDPDSGDKSFLAPNLIGMIPSEGFVYDWTDIKKEYENPGSFNESNSATKQDTPNNTPKTITPSEGPSNNHKTTIIVVVVVVIVVVIAIIVVVVIIILKKKKNNNNQSSGSGTELSDEDKEDKTPENK